MELSIGIGKMQITLNKKYKMVLIERDENDSPRVEIPDPRPENPSRKEYNSWRKDYSLIFPSLAGAERAYAKMIELRDFDKAAEWLDKQ